MHRWQNIRLRQKESANITIQPYAKKGLTPHGLLPFPWEKKKPEHTKAALAVSKEDALKRFEEVLGKWLQWGAAESVQDKIQLTAKHSGTKNRGLSDALKKNSI